MGSASSEAAISGVSFTNDAGEDNIVKVHVETGSLTLTVELSPDEAFGLARQLEIQAAAALRGAARH
jgi:hypothetical protein